MPHHCCLKCLSLQGYSPSTQWSTKLPWKASQTSSPSPHTVQVQLSTPVCLTHLWLLEGQDLSSSSLPVFNMNVETGMGACLSLLLSKQVPFLYCGHCSTLKPVLYDPTSYQLRKHLSRLLHLKQLGARDVLRCTQVCTALLLHVWKKELELKFPKPISVSRISKSPSKGMSATKSARHSVLRQIYGKYSSGHFVALWDPECHATICNKT